MRPVLTAQAMREADRITIEEYGLPGFTLMETAGRGAADQIEQMFGSMAGRTVACFCGKGNNGGDGLVVARVLLTRGVRVRVVTLAEADEMSDDAAHNFRLLQRLAEHVSDDYLDIIRFESLSQMAAYPEADLYVDALLGTGLTSDLREPIRSIVTWLNDQPQSTVALDMPTGLHSDDGRVLGIAIRADLTVTMAALKAGQLVGQGPQHAGQVEVVEIGIPRFVLNRVRKTPGCALAPTAADLAAWLPQRAPDAHKYSAGLALVVGGAPGLTGAPVMSSMAAARAGAGFVVCACPASIQPTLAHHLTTVTTRALPQTDDGGIDPDRTPGALEERLRKASALLVGPGLGTAPATQQFVRALLAETDLPLVVDADGLNALADTPDLIRQYAEGRWILTPHAGEFRRLAGDVDLTDRIRVAQTYAQRWNGVLLLKGLPSLVATPEGAVYISYSNTPALATAGTGDVLSGLCVGLLAQGLSPERAAVCALYLSGLAAERYVAEYSLHSMVATDLIDQLPYVFPTDSS